MFSCARKAREDLDAKNQKLAEMEADYGDVVPRRDFERLEAQFNVRTPPHLPSTANIDPSLFTSFSSPQPYSLLLAGRALARETKGSGGMGFQN